jgi:hypothetical protein
LTKGSEKLIRIDAQRMACSISSHKNKLSQVSFDTFAEELNKQTSKETKTEQTKQNRKSETNK